MKIALELLDSAQGHPVQTWRFDGQLQIRIGRGEDNDVLIADPRVSRLHAELQWDLRGWRITSKGRNGVHVGGQRIDAVPLADRDVFQLCANGLTLRFRENLDPTTSTMTVDSADQSLVALLQIDERKKAEEVREITSGSLFQRLKQRADELRRKHGGRGSDDDETRT